jgi:integrase
MDETKNTTETKSLKKYSRKQDIRRFFFPGEYLATLEQMKPKQRHTSTLLLNTGTRINEMRNVKVSDIDLDNLFMKISHTKAKARKGESKGHGKVRIIPISSKFSKYLRQYIKDNKLGSEDTLGVLSTPAYDICIKKAVAKAGIRDPDNFSAHNLRKTLECWLVAMDVQDSRLYAHFGHDPKTAASHYISPDIFNSQMRGMMRDIIGDLYKRRNEV